MMLLCDLSIIVDNARRIPLLIRGSVEFCVVSEDILCYLYCIYFMYYPPYVYVMSAMKPLESSRKKTSENSRKETYGKL